MPVETFNIYGQRKAISQFVLGPNGRPIDRDANGVPVPTQFVSEPIRLAGRIALQVAPVMRFLPIDARLWLERCVAPPRESDTAMDWAEATSEAFCGFDIQIQSRQEINAPNGWVTSAPTLRHYDEPAAAWFRVVGLFRQDNSVHVSLSGGAV